MKLYLTRLQTIPADPAGHRAALSEAAHRLLAYALQAEGLYPAGMTLCREPSGKPYLQDAPHLQFSLSHSGAYAVCLCSDVPVGVDIERIRPVSATLWARYLADYPGEEVGTPAEAILRWTRYEALLKRCGRPVSENTREACLSLSPVPGYQLSIAGQGSLEPLIWVSPQRLNTFPPID